VQRSTLLVTVAALALPLTALVPAQASAAPVAPIPARAAQAARAARAAQAGVHTYRLATGDSVRMVTAPDGAVTASLVAARRTCGPEGRAPDTSCPGRRLPGSDPSPCPCSTRLPWPG
jgi:hypothetical protein